MASGVTCTLRGCHTLPFARLAGLFGFTDATPRVPTNILTNKIRHLFSSRMHVARGYSVTVWYTAYTQPGAFCFLGWIQLLYASNTGMAFPQSLLHFFFNGFCIGWGSTEKARGNWMHFLNASHSMSLTFFYFFFIFTVAVFRLFNFRNYTIAAFLN